MAMALEVDVERQLGATRIRARFAAANGVTALFGHSGAGKTSLVNMIAGLLRPARGRIVVDGRVLFDAAQRINLPPRRRRIGYIFQESRLFPHMSVRRNLLYGARLTAPAARWAEPDRVIDLLGIAHLLGRRPALLSGGERQRVAIGRALLASPVLLLMDEPLASLDARRKAEILPYLERLRDELALPIVYVSHQFDEVKRLANTLVVLRDGQLVAAGPLNAVLGRPELAAAGPELAGVVVEARVAGHDELFGLTRLDSPLGELVVPKIGRPQGAAVRLHVHALDVAVALTPPLGLSIQNVLPATVKAIVADTSAHAALQLDVAGAPLLAHVTRKAVESLALRPGQRVHALIKSVAIDRGESP